MIDQRHTDEALGEHLAAATVIAAEEGQRAVVAHEMEIVSVRQDLARLDRERVALRERLDGLLAQGKVKVRARTMQRGGSSTVEPQCNQP